MRPRLLPLSLALAALVAGIGPGQAASARAESVTPIECEGDSCQVLPPPPEDPALGTAFLTPEVNPPPHYTKPPAAKRKHRGKRHPQRPHRTRPSR